MVDRGKGEIASSN